MKNRLFIGNGFIASALLFSLWACEPSEKLLDSWNNTDRAVSVKAKIQHYANTRLNSHEAGDTWMLNDLIGLKSETYSDAFVCYKYDSEKWIPLIDTERLVWRADMERFVAIYPFVELSTTETNFSLPLLQTHVEGSELWRADYMVFEDACEFGETGALQIHFVRKMAKISVVITETKDYLGEVPVFSEFKIRSAFSGYKEAAPAGDPVWISPMHTTLEGGNNNFTAILVPTAELKDATFLTMRVSESTEEGAPIHDFTVTGIPEFKAGFAYRIHLRVGKNGAEIGAVTANQWKDSANLGEFDFSFGESGSDKLPTSPGDSELPDSPEEGEGKDGDSELNPEISPDEDGEDGVEPEIPEIPEEPGVNPDEDQHATYSFVGEGTIHSPFLIQSHEQLTKIHEYLLENHSFEGYHFKMTNNIELGTTPLMSLGYYDGIETLLADFPNQSSNNLFGEMGSTPEIDYDLINSWQPRHQFGGILDGGHYTIKGNFGDLNRSYQGLFVAIAPTGVVKNLRIEIATSASGKYYFGAICGFNNGQITHAYTLGSGTVTMRMGGGLVGINNGTIIQSASTVKLAPSGSGGNGSFFGGFCGLNLKEIRESASACIMTGYSAHSTGGFFGKNMGLIQTCLSSISATYSAGFGGQNVGEVSNSVGFANQATMFGRQVGVVSLDYTDGKNFSSSTSMTSHLKKLNDKRQDSYGYRFITGDSGSKYQPRLSILAL